MKTASDLRALIVGSGSIGQRHARNLMALGVKKLALCDKDPSQLQQAASELENDVTFTDYVHALEQFKPDIVLVCTPPVLHVEQALIAVRAGAHVFVEKPLSNQLTGIDNLIAATQATGRIVHVGYNLRFHAGILKLRELLFQQTIGRVLWAYAEVGQYLPDWRPRQDYRRSYTARHELGGGIILDASHEIDYILWMLGEPISVTCMAGQLSDLEVNVEDSADILLRFPTRTQAVIHLDFIQRDYSRRCKIVGTNGTITWDYVTNQIDVYRAADRERQTLNFSVSPNQMYLDEIAAFLDAIRSHHTSLASLHEAKTVVKVALAALESSERRCTVDLNSNEAKR